MADVNIRVPILRAAFLAPVTLGSSWTAMDSTAQVRLFSVLFEVLNLTQPKTCQNSYIIINYV